MLPLVNTVTDASVAMRYYTRGHLLFFWISTSLFCIAQVAYAVFFVQMYAARRNSTFQFVAFLILLPFGQVLCVPVRRIFSTVRVCSYCRW